MRLQVKSILEQRAEQSSIDLIDAISNLPCSSIWAFPGVGYHQPKVKDQLLRSESMSVLIRNLIRSPRWPSTAVYDVNLLAEKRSLDTRRVSGSV